MKKVLLLLFILTAILAGMAFTAYHQSISGDLNFPWTYDQELDKYVPTPLFNLTPLAYAFAFCLLAFYSLLMWQKARLYQRKEAGSFFLRLGAWFLLFWTGIIMMIALEAWGAIATPPEENSQYFYLLPGQQIGIIASLIAASWIFGFFAVVERKPVPGT